MRTIVEHWDDYAKHCIPANAGQEQVATMRASFYTGAQVVLSILYSMPAPAWTNEARVAVIDGLQGEIYDLVGRKRPDEDVGHA